MVSRRLEHRLMAAPNSTMSAVGSTLAEILSDFVLVQVEVIAGRIHLPNSIRTHTC